MSVSYNRVNWADYPATTTPVNATNLNKMDKGIADLTREVNSVESDMSDLNSSLDDIDIRYNATTGKPEWRERGADSFSPFSNNAIEYIFTRPTTAYDSDVYSYDADNGYRKDHNSVAWNTKYIVEAMNRIRPSCLRSIVFSGSYSAIVTIEKAGYYSTYHDSAYAAMQPTYYNSGDTFTITSAQAFSITIYHGETNPFE